MTTIAKPPAADKALTRDERVDLREQLFNGRAVGPIERVQLAAVNITTLHGVLYDIDPGIFVQSVDGEQHGAFYERVLRPMLDRHPVLAAAEVRNSGRGLHVIPWFADPVVIDSDGERRRWEGAIKVLQAALPVDPDQPGLTALTRPIGSINSKTGRAVSVLRPGTPVPVADVLGLFDQMVRAPFRTVMHILLGGDRVMPCPVCRTEGTSLTALDHVGRCYGSCGKVKVDQLYDLFLAPRKPVAKVGR
jgi:hypothetical protein